MALIRPTKGELARVVIGLAWKQPVAQRRVRQERSVRLASVCGIAASSDVV